MDITQTFYDQLAVQYDKLFLDWKSTTKEQGKILQTLFRANGFDESARILDCGLFWRKNSYCSLPTVEFSPFNRQCVDF